MDSLPLNRPYIGPLLLLAANGRPPFSHARGVRQVNGFLWPRATLLCREGLPGNFFPLRGLRPEDAESPVAQIRHISRTPAGATAGTVNGLYFMYSRSPHALYVAQSAGTGTVFLHSETLPSLRPAAPKTWNGECPGGGTDDPAPRQARCTRKPSARGSQGPAANHPATRASMILHANPASNSSG